MLHIMIRIMGILSKLNLFDITESERTEVKGVTIMRFVMSPVTEV